MDRLSIDAKSPAPASRGSQASAESSIRLRVGLVSYSLPAEGAKRGGIERIAHDLAHGLGERGHVVTVWSYDPQPAGASYEVRSLPGRRFVGTWLGLRLTMGYLGNVLSALPDFSATDAVIAMGDSLLLPLRGRPVVRVMHGSALGEALSASSPFRFTLQIGVYAQELLTALLQPGTVAVSENTLRHNPFVRRVISNGVDLSAFQPTGSKATAPTILFVGSMGGRKRGALLLRWFREKIQPGCPGARLVIVGQPGEQADGVTYQAGISTAGLAQLYREAWVYASPSRYEGFGLPYVEAMASGTPVVATPNPGSVEVLANGRFGVLASDDEFPDAVIRLLSDRAAREALTGAGMERAREFGLERMIDQYEALLHELVGPPSRVRRRAVA